MDDPWGSPWTSTDHDHGSAKLAFDSSPGLRPAQPPTNPPLSLDTFAESSPWAAEDDAAFGDWATADAQGETAGAASAWMGGAEPNPDVFPDLEATQIRPTAWTASTVTASGPSQHTQANIDLPSTIREPWDADSPTTEQDSIPKISSRSGAAGDVDSINTFGVEGLSGATEPALQRDEAASLQATSSRESTPEPVRPGEELVEAHLEEHGSRPPSSNFDGSDHVDLGQGSPTTSAEDNTKPAVQQESSPKVQDLVELYDGLSDKPTKAALPRPPDGEAKSSQENGSRGPPVDPLGQVSRAVPEPSSSIVPATPDSPPRPPTVNEGVAQHPEDTLDNAAAAAFLSEASPTRFLDRLGYRHHTPDLAQIDTLFSDGTGGQARADTPLAHENEANLGGTDCISVDSFTTISERKAWYRISRQGSHRKHNAGDDENYRPVAWAVSTVHAETIAIVRRWMEEDSLTGKPTLGGSSVRGNLFGWNSAAEPVALEAVFKTARNSRSGLPHPAKNGGPSPARVFGWGRTDALGRMPENLVRSPEAPAGALSAANDALPPSSESAKSAKGATAAGASTATETDNTDLEDAWGEMVVPSADEGSEPLAAMRGQAAAVSEEEGLAARFVDSFFRGLPSLSYMEK